MSQNRMLIHVESPLRPQPGDAGWPKGREAGDLASNGTGETCQNAAFAANQKFAKDVCREICLSGRNAIAPHIYYTEFLNDFVPAERDIGLECGLQLQRLADEVWFCLPPWRAHFSPGMLAGIARANDAKLVTRSLVGTDALETALRKS